MLCDDARGEYASSTITSDLDIAAIDRLPLSAFHHNVNVLVASADEEGYVTTYIIAPGFIYGHPTGPLFDGPEPIAHARRSRVQYMPTYSRRGVVLE